MKNKNLQCRQNCPAEYSRFVMFNGGEMPELPKEPEKPVQAETGPIAPETAAKEAKERGEKMIQAGQERVEKVSTRYEPGDDVPDADWAAYEKAEKTAEKVWNEVSGLFDGSEFSFVTNLEGDQTKNAGVLKKAYERLGYTDSGKRSEFFVSDTFDGTAPEPVSPFDRVNVKALKTTLEGWMKKNKRSENRENPVVAIMRMQGSAEYAAWKKNADTLRTKYKDTVAFIRSEKGSRAA
jgi:hypothetical protein